MVKPPGPAGLLDVQGRMGGLLIWSGTGKQHFGKIRGWERKTWTWTFDRAVTSVA
jgi:hypothetical protein